MSAPRNIRKERVSEFIVLCLRRGVPADALREFLLYVGVDAKVVHHELPRPQGNWHSSSVGREVRPARTPAAETPVLPPPGAPPLPSLSRQERNAAQPQAPVAAPSQDNAPLLSDHPQMQEATREISMQLKTMTRIIHGARKNPNVPAPASGSEVESTRSILGINMPIKLVLPASERERWSAYLKQRQEKQDPASKSRDKNSSGRNAQERLPVNRQVSGKTSGKSAENRRVEPAAEPAPEPIQRARDWLHSLLSTGGVMVDESESSPQDTPAEDAISPTVRRIAKRR